MSEINNSAINYHAYNVHDGESLISQVQKVVAVLLPRGLIVAGFSEQGDLLMIRYGDYSQTLPTWILDFYEHRFIDEPLLGQPEKIVATFIASNKYLLIPEQVYDEADAVKWMRSIHFIEGHEVLSDHRLHEDRAHYLYAYPGTIKSLIGRYFANARLLPLSSYQFYKPYKADGALQCTITPEHAFATLYKNRNLQWHQVFDYSCGEDIAYHLKLLCKQLRIDADSLEINCSVAYRGLNPVLNSLRQYFPNVADTDLPNSGGQVQWTATVGLLQQLYACES